MDANEMWQGHKPKPYYDEDGITIYCADNREVLPHIHGDIVVTSPPYNTLPSKHSPSGMHADRKSGVNKWIKKASEGYFDQMDEWRYQAWIVGVVGTCFGVVDGLVWVNHKTRYRDGEGIHPARMFPFPIYSEVIWDRNGSMALNCKRFAPSHETLIGFGKPHFWDDGLNAKMSVWRIPPQLEPEHPCPFPIELPMRAILSSCPEGGTVIDPFAGSGTTLVAAKQAGRKAIGIEIEQRFCDIAVNRLSHSVLPFSSDFTVSEHTEIRSQYEMTNGE